MREPPAVAMEPGYRSPLVDLFRRGEAPRDARLLAAQGALSAAAHEQIALLVLLSDDDDAEIAGTAEATLRRLAGDALRAYLARPDVTTEIRDFFTARGVLPADTAAAGADEPIIADTAGEAAEDPRAGGPVSSSLSGLSITAKIKLATKGTREQRAQLIRDPNRIVAAAVLSSPKLTETEVEAFARMANVSEEVLRVIGTTRAWLKSYTIVLGLVRNPKTPPAISMQLLQRLGERDLKALTIDRNVPEALRVAARKKAVRELR